MMELCIASSATIPTAPERIRYRPSWVRDLDRWSRSITKASDSASFWNVLNNAIEDYWTVIFNDLGIFRPFFAVVCTIYSTFPPYTPITVAKTFNTLWQVRPMRWVLFAVSCLRWIGWPVDWGAAGLRSQSLSTPVIQTLSKRPNFRCCWLS